MKQFALAMWVLGVAWTLCTTQAVAADKAQAVEPNPRDALLQHFNQYHLVPVFAPQDELEPRAVLSPGRALRTRRAERFLGLLLSERQAVGEADLIATDLSADGSFAPVVCNGRDVIDGAIGEATAGKRDPLIDPPDNC